MLCRGCVLSLKIRRLVRHCLSFRRSIVVWLGWGLGFVVAVVVDECACGVALWAFGFGGWPGFFAVCAVGCFLVVDE